MHLCTRCPRIVGALVPNFEESSEVGVHVVVSPERLRCTSSLLSIRNKIDEVPRLGDIYYLDCVEFTAPDAWVGKTVLESDYDASMTNSNSGVEEKRS